VAVVEPRNTNLHIAYRPGLRHPIHVAASGLAILAGTFAPGERPEVETDRRLGYAISTGELLPGATGVACPIPIPSLPAEASISAVWVGQRDPAEPAALVVRSVQAIARGLA